MAELSSRWQIIGPELKAEFVLTTFSEAMQFVNQIAVEAEKMDHHPKIAIDYNKVTLTLTTHAVNGLTDKDFSLAKLIDGIRA